ncbi:hypothetical protein AMJ48_00915 [Parcubacteria bacterium DG_74_1]|nr:MAG: hypothetical protein AMJ48_00915 [Parcubacteria bacterium DG_74_1]
MSYSITGVAYLVLLFPVGFLIYRLFQYWKKEKSAVSKQALYIASLFGLFVLIDAISGLFFADSPLPPVLSKKIEVGVFIQALIFAVIAYHIIYLKFPKISPWLGFIPVLVLGLIAAILSVVLLQFNPFLEASGAINWGFPSSSMAVFVSSLRLFLSLITIIPLSIIFLSQFKNSEDPYIRAKSLGLGLAFLFILIVASFDFLFINTFNLGAIGRDIALIVCSIILFITLILTMPRPLSGPSSYYIKTSNKL